MRNFFAYEIKWGNRAVASLLRLDNKDAGRVKDKVKALAQLSNPTGLKNLVRLQGDLKPFYKLVVTPSLRAILHIIQNEQRLIVLEVGQRQSIYNKYEKYVKLKGVEAIVYEADKGKATQHYKNI
ncbi:MAG: hypothetical protein QM613_04120 [Micrococcaceae bacterium]